MMINRSLAAVLALSTLATLNGCATLSRLTSSHDGEAQIKAADGSPAGSARLVTRDGATVVALTVEGLSPGTHGVHLHTVGQCTGDFSSALGHLNPDHRRHGSLAGAGPHLGDLPNIDVGIDGRGSFDLPLKGDREAIQAAMFDLDGTALIVHDQADDYRTDPSGNSGKRVACGVFGRSR